MEQRRKYDNLSSLSAAHSTSSATKIDACLPETKIKHLKQTQNWLFNVFFNKPTYQNKSIYWTKHLHYLHIYIYIYISKDIESFLVIKYNQNLYMKVKICSHDHKQWSEKKKNSEEKSVPSWVRLIGENVRKKTVCRREREREGTIMEEGG